jgi:molybdopterin synthase catalytic subunit
LIPWTKDWFEIRETEKFKFRRPSLNSWLIKLHVRSGVHQKGTVKLADILEDIKSNPGFRKTGAIAFFIGVVRGDGEGKKVEKLELEAYEEKANEVLRGICDDLKREGIVDVQIHHMLGEFNVGEELVYVAVAGSHRQNVFPILEEAVDRYKKEAPIFKKEHTIDGKGRRSAYWESETKQS